MSLLTEKKYYSLLHIRQAEARPFFLLIAHAFFNGMGIALSFTAINLLLIEYHAVSYLPYNFIGIGLLLLITGLAYIKLESAIKPAVLFQGLILFCSLWAMLTGLGLVFYCTLSVVLLVFITYYITYFCSNLEFWGVASLLFDVRQSKRIFGPLTVGESVAKIAGYSLTPFITHYLTLNSSFFIAAVCFFASWGILRHVSHKFSLQVEHEHGHIHEAPLQTSMVVMTILEIANKIKSSTFIQGASILSLIAGIISFFLYFTFLDRIKEQYHDLESAAVFFGTLLSFSKIINLVTKLFISGRILRYLGLGVSLLFLPALILMVNLFGFANFFSGSEYSFFFLYVFSANYLIDESFRSSIYNPSYFSVFQPLSRSKRLEAHTIVKGIMEPIGIVLAGLLILLLKNNGYFDFKTLILTVLILSLVWLAAAFNLLENYKLVLGKALDLRILPRMNFFLKTEELNIIKNKLKSNQEQEVIAALQLLSEEKKWKNLLAEPIRRLLKSKDDNIVFGALSITMEGRIPDLSADVEVLFHAGNPLIRQKAIQTFSYIKGDRAMETLQLLLETATDSSIQNTIILSGLKYGGIYGKIFMGNKLIRLVESPVASDKLNALNIIREIGDTEYYPFVRQLLLNEDETIRRACISAIAELGQSPLLEQLLELLATDQYRLDAHYAFIRLGHHVHPFLIANLPLVPETVQVSILKILTITGEESCSEAIVNFLESRKFPLRNQAIAVLHRIGYRADKNTTPMLNRLLDEHLEAIETLLNTCLSETDPVFRETMEEEVDVVLIPNAVKILGFLHGNDVSVKVLEALAFTDNSFRANAIEVIDNAMKSSGGKKLVAVLENWFYYKNAPFSVAESTENATIQASTFWPSGYSDWFRLLFEQRFHSGTP